MASVAKRKWTHKGVENEAWVVRYTDQGGKRRMKTFDKKKDADKHRSKVDAEIRDGLHVPESETMTVSQVSELYIRDAEDRLSDGRIGRGHFYNIKNALDVSIVPELGRRLVTDLTPQIVVDWYRVMLRNGQLKPITARGRVGRLKAIQDFAIKRRLMVHRPVNEAIEELRGLRFDQVRTFTSAEVSNIFVLAARRRPRVKARTTALFNCYIHLAAFCGLRYGEIQGLSVTGVDFVGGMVRIRQSVTPYDELKSPKTRAGIRDVPMPSHIAAMLAAWLQLYYVENERQLLFRTSSGSLIENAYFHGYLWKPLLRQAGLEPVNGQDWHHFHALRHFAASWMIEHRLPLTEVAKLIGHAKVSTTVDTYGHALGNDFGRHQVFGDMARNLLTIDATTAQQGLPSR